MEQQVASHPLLCECLAWGQVSASQQGWSLTLRGDFADVFQEIDQLDLVISRASFDRTHRVDAILNALHSHRCLASLHDLHLTFIDTLDGHLDRLGSAPCAEFLVALNLANNDLDDAELSALSRSAMTKSVEKLWLPDNVLTVAALDTITEFEKLSVLNLARQGDWNDVDLEPFSKLDLNLLFLEGNGIDDSKLVPLQFDIDFSTDLSLDTLRESARKAVTLKNDEAVDMICDRLSEFDDVDAVKTLVWLLIATDGNIAVRNALVQSVFLEVSKLLIDAVTRILEKNETIPVPVADAIGEVLAERIDGPVDALEKLLEIFEVKGLPTQHLNTAVSHVSHGLDG